MYALEGGGVCVWGEGGGRVCAGFLSAAGVLQCRRCLSGASAWQTEQSRLLRVLPAMLLHAPGCHLCISRLISLFWGAFLLLLEAPLIPAIIPLPEMVSSPSGVDLKMDTSATPPPPSSSLPVALQMQRVCRRCNTPAVCGSCE